MSMQRTRVGAPRFSYRPALLLLLLIAIAARTATVEVTVLQTSDIHAHVGPWPRESRSSDWLRLATVLKQQRDAAGGPLHSLTIDCGDTIQGSLMGVVSRGQAPLAVLDGLGYDFWVIGNHEFDFGTKRLRELLPGVKTPILAGNLQLDGAPPFAAWRMVVKSGARIAVIGMTTPHLREWFDGPLYEGFRVEPALTALERILPDITRQQPDAIVLAIHQGFIQVDARKTSEVKDIAYRFPQIDLILGGHTHRAFPGERIGRGTWYVQPGEHARHLAKVTMTIDTSAHRVEKIESELLPITGDIPVDEDAQALVADWLATCRNIADRPIREPRTTISHLGLPGLDCAQSDLMCRALAWKGNAVVALHGTLAKETWAKGAMLTEQALYRAIPYENYLVVSHLTLDELRQVVQEQLDNRTNYTYNGVWGVKVTVDKATWKVTGIELPGRQPAPGERLPVAMHSYAAAGGGGRYPVLLRLISQPEARTEHRSENTRDIVREYILNVPSWDAPPTAWLDLR